MRDEENLWAYAKLTIMFILSIATLLAIYVANVGPL